MPTVRGAAQPDELPVALNDFPEADIHAWRTPTVYAKDLAGRDLSLNGDMEIINNELSALETCPDLDGKTTPLCKSGCVKIGSKFWKRPRPFIARTGGRSRIAPTAIGSLRLRLMIQKMGAELSGELAEVYQRPAPSE